MAEDGLLLVCLPFLLEVGLSARNATELATVRGGLQQFPHVPVDEEVERLALAAQARLPAAGRHRLPPADVLVAALAHRHGAGVLHYDKHFDLLAERSGLAFDSVWLAPRGAL